MRALALGPTNIHSVETNLKGWSLERVVDRAGCDDSHVNGSRECGRGRGGPYVLPSTRAVLGSLSCLTKKVRECQLPTCLWCDMVPLMQCMALTVVSCN